MLILIKHTRRTAGRQLKAIIVHYDKIRLHNGVNLVQGFRTIEIRSPAEVIEYEDEEDV